MEFIAEEPYWSRSVPPPTWYHRGTPLMYAPTHAAPTTIMPEFSRPPPVLPPSARVLRTPTRKRQFSQIKNPYKSVAKDKKAQAFVRTETPVDAIMPTLSSIKNPSVLSEISTESPLHPDETPPLPTDLLYYGQNANLFDDNSVETSNPFFDSVNPNKSFNSLISFKDGTVHGPIDTAQIESITKPSFVDSERVSRDTLEDTHESGLDNSAQSVPSLSVPTPPEITLDLGNQAAYYNPKPSSHQPNFPRSQPFVPASSPDVPPGPNENLNPTQVLEALKQTVVDSLATPPRQGLGYNPTQPFSSMTGHISPRQLTKLSDRPNSSALQNAMLSMFMTTGLIKAIDSLTTNVLRYRSNRVHEHAAIAAAVIGGITAATGIAAAGVGAADTAKNIKAHKTAYVGGPTMADIGSTDDVLADAGPISESEAKRPALQNIGNGYRSDLVITSAESPINSDTLFFPSYELLPRLTYPQYIGTYEFADLDLEYVITPQLITNYVTPMFNGFAAFQLDIFLRIESSVPVGSSYLMTVTNIRADSSSHGSLFDLAADSVVEIPFAIQRYVTIINAQDTKMYWYLKLQPFPHGYDYQPAKFKVYLVCRNFKFFGSKAPLTPVKLTVPSKNITSRRVTEHASLCPFAEFDYNKIPYICDTVGTYSLDETNSSITIKPQDYISVLKSMWTFNFCQKIHPVFTLEYIIQKSPLLSGIVSIEKTLVNAEFSTEIYKCDIATLPSIISVTAGVTLDFNLLDAPLLSPISLMDGTYADTVLDSVRFTVDGIATNIETNNAFILTVRVALSPETRIVGPCLGYAPNDFFRIGDSTDSLDGQAVIDDLASKVWFSMVMPTTDDTDPDASPTRVQVHDGDNLFLFSSAVPITFTRSYPPKSFTFPGMPIETIFKQNFTRELAFTQFTTGPYYTPSDSFCNVGPTALFYGYDRCRSGWWLHPFMFVCYMSAQFTSSFVATVSISATTNSPSVYTLWTTAFDGDDPNASKLNEPNFYNGKFNGDPQQIDISTTRVVTVKPHHHYANRFNTFYQAFNNDKLKPFGYSIYLSTDALPSETGGLPDAPRMIAQIETDLKVYGLLALDLRKLARQFSKSPFNRMFKE